MPHNLQIQRHVYESLSPGDVPCMLDSSCPCESEVAGRTAAIWFKTSKTGYLKARGSCRKEHTKQTPASRCPKDPAIVCVFVTANIVNEILAASPVL